VYIYIFGISDDWLTWAPPAFPIYLSTGYITCCHVVCRGEGRGGEGRGGKEKEKEKEEKEESP
jgi:hypothetical protein